MNIPPPSTRLAIVVLLGLVSSASGDPAGIDRFYWDGKRLPLDPPPAGLAPPAIGVIGFWRGWCDEQAYTLHLSRDQRVLLLVAENRGRPKDELTLIERTCSYFDAFLPAPSREDIGPGPLSDDEDDPFRERGDRDPGAAPGAAAETGTPYAEGARDTETAVLIEARDAGDYRSCLEHLGAAHPYLESWLESAAKLAGVSLARPLCTTWLRTGSGLEEYDTDNELVHRLAQLLLWRRFGALPFWLQSGLAWHFEWELLGSIYCFPYRNEFVFAVEHEAWPSMLSSRNSARQELVMEDFCDWKRGSFEIDPALRSWGLACYLARERPELATPVLEDLRRLQDSQGKVYREDSSWERIAGFESRAADQRKVFEQHLGEDFLDRVLAFMKQVDGPAAVKSKVKLRR